jgi:hypothetical protein
MRMFSFEDAELKRNMTRRMYPSTGSDRHAYQRKNPAEAGF